MPSQSDLDEITFVEILEDSVESEADKSEREEERETIEVDRQEREIKEETLEPLDLPLDSSQIPTDSDLTPTFQPSVTLTLPCALNRITPHYPRMARRKGHEGRVLVEAEIAADGNVSRVLVKESSGYPELDAAAVKAVRQAEFQPARDGERPVAGTISIPIEFRLRDL